MAAISAQMVKELREKTGAGMMDCKKALEEMDGDLEKALDWLRQKGIAKAAKKSGRVTSEGLVGFVASACGKKAALAEVRCETDFVARGEQFQAFVGKVVNVVLEKAPADTAALEALLGDALSEQIAVIGENMTLGKIARVEQSGSGVIGSYIHSNGKIAVLVDLKASSDAAADKDAFKELAKNIAMQIAAANPLAVDPSGVDAEAVERERQIYVQKAKDEGKPENIVAKIADGAVNKFYKEVCLLQQPYIRDDKKTVQDIIKEASKDIGETAVVGGFVRIQLGAE